jgi:hypothetical protein
VEFPPCFKNKHINSTTRKEERKMEIYEKEK